MTVSTANRHRVSLVLGTRPEAIKLAPVILALRDHATLESHICATGQHREMVLPIFEAFGIKPDAGLALMQQGQTLAQFTGRAIEAIDQYYAEAQPDLVVVQGDTTTVLCAALAAYYRRIPVAHVEAGLRTHNRYSPFPEELNRTLATRLADLHFAPTETAREHLLSEGIASFSISVTGNTVIDALQLAVERLKNHPVEIPGLPRELTDGDSQSSPLVLITGHRRESFGKGFEQICRAIAALARQHPNVAFVYPVHLNPNVQEPVRRILGSGSSSDVSATLPNIHLIAPLDYLPFVQLMNRATLILTDSGGVQEEAPSLGKPVLVMRETTERPEAVALGLVKLVGTNETLIIAETSKLLGDEAARAAMARAANPYGDGHAAERIVERCASFLAQRSTGNR